MSKVTSLRNLLGILKSSTDETHSTPSILEISGDEPDQLDQQHREKVLIPNYLFLPHEAAAVVSEFEGEMVRSWKFRWWISDDVFVLCETEGSRGLAASVEGSVQLVMFCYNVVFQGGLFAPNNDEDLRTWVIEDPWDHGCYFIEHWDNVFTNVSSCSVDDDDT
ncbi:unnamed protein product [Vicia faba]|uniref:Uncharacterized protein n=1 Tax=Vicia faba TaxID=3906 RepID=A0AAV1B8F3_VICFA|nr:unnamed protein product [Vicia faba]